MSISVQLESSYLCTFLIFWYKSFQAVEEVNRNNIRAEGRLYELKALQDAKKATEYLALCRTLPGYGDVVFPHCACDSRKEGHVIPAVGECNEFLLNFHRWTNYSVISSSYKPFHRLYNIQTIPPSHHHINHSVFPSSYEPFRLPFIIIFRLSSIIQTIPSSLHPTNHSVFYLHSNGWFN